MVNLKQVSHIKHLKKLLRAPPDRSCQVMVSVLDPRSGRQAPASEEDDLVIESGEDSIADEPEPEDEQPEDHQAGPQEPMCGAGKSNWAANPKKAPLRPFMGIPTGMDSKSQESLSRDFRPEVR